MIGQEPREIILIRHAPASHGGRLCGRTDVGCELPGAEVLERFAALIGPVARLWASPAQRCTSTASAVFPKVSATPDPRLWEQDYGEWEGVVVADLPDLGLLAGADLAEHAPPGGESFAGVCARIAPALEEIAAGAGRAAVVAHAGTVRAGLALALGSPGAALAFEVAPLSATLLRKGSGGWSIGYVNATSRG